MNTDKNRWRQEELSLLYEADNIVIWYHARHEILYLDWIGYQKEAALKDAAERILKILSNRKCGKVLNDNSNVIGPWYHSVDWATTDWFPRMIKAGLKQFAWICSDDVFTQLSAKRAIPDGNIVKAFNTLEEGVKWLTEERYWQN